MLLLQWGTNLEHAFNRPTTSGFDWLQKTAAHHHRKKHLIKLNTAQSIKSSASTARHPNIIPARSKVGEDTASFKPRRNCHTGMRIMWTGETSTFTSEHKTQRKSRASEICQNAGGKQKLSLRFWNGFHGDKSTNFSKILRECKIRGMVW